MTDTKLVNKVSTENNETLSKSLNTKIFLVLLVQSGPFQRPGIRLQFIFVYFIFSEKDDWVERRYGGLGGGRK